MAESPVDTAQGKSRYKVVFTPVGWQVTDSKVARDPVAEFGLGRDEFHRAKVAAEGLNAEDVSESALTEELRVCREHTAMLTRMLRARTTALEAALASSDQPCAAWEEIVALAEVWKAFTQQQGDLDGWTLYDTFAEGFRRALASVPARSPEIVEDSYAIREKALCGGCGKRRLTTPTNLGPRCNDCLAARSPDGLTEALTTIRETIFDNHLTPQARVNAVKAYFTALARSAGNGDEQ